jgi:hypothetical protein
MAGQVGVAPELPTVIELGLQASKIHRGGRGAGGEDPKAPEVMAQADTLPFPRKIDQAVRLTRNGTITYRQRWAIALRQRVTVNSAVSCFAK